VFNDRRPDRAFIRSYDLNLESEMMACYSTAVVRWDGMQSWSGNFTTECPERAFLARRKL
jgi:hypothetical protein